MIHLAVHGQARFQRTKHLKLECLQNASPCQLRDLDSFCVCELKCLKRAKFRLVHMSAHPWRWLKWRPPGCLYAPLLEMVGQLWNIRLSQKWQVVNVDVLVTCFASIWPSAACVQAVWRGEVSLCQCIQLGAVENEAAASPGNRCSTILKNPSRPGISGHQLFMHRIQGNCDPSSWMDQLN